MTRNSRCICHYQVITHLVSMVMTVVAVVTGSALLWHPLILFCCSEDINNVVASCPGCERPWHLLNTK